MAEAEIFEDFHFLLVRVHHLTAFLVGNTAFGCLHLRFWVENGFPRLPPAEQRCVWDLEVC
jgi:hypothetical protein